MMRLAYIILAHTAPDHLLRLVERLNHPDDTFYIHIDLKKDISLFTNKFKFSSAKVLFVQNRVDGRWGGIGIVEATINAMKEIVHSKVEYQHVVLLSGSDYPLKSTDKIRQFYQEHHNKVFITFEKLPLKKLIYEGRDRTECYSFNIGNRRETYIPFSWKPKLSFKGKVLNLLLGLVVLFKKKRVFPFEWNAYYGSQWWSMSFHALSFIVEYLNNHPSYLKYHQYTLLPDELFFQSIILNAYERIDFVINDNKRYINFPVGSSHPKIFDESDVNNLINSKKLFARKFKPGSKLLNILDKKI